MMIGPDPPQLLPFVRTPLFLDDLRNHTIALPLRDNWWGGVGF
jgi:hypothetical protein